jgi:lysozyme
MTSSAAVKRSMCANTIGGGRARAAATAISNARMHPAMRRRCRSRRAPSPPNASTRSPDDVEPIYKPVQANDYYKASQPALRAPQDWQLSPSFKKALKKREELRLDVYKDSAGKDTIGYGHRPLPGENFSAGITQEEAEDLLNRDLAKARITVDSCVHVRVPQMMYESMVSLAFNVGGNAFCKSKLVRKVNARDFDGASLEFRDWGNVTTKDASGQDVLQKNEGLTARRLWEEDMFNGRGYGR